MKTIFNKIKKHSNHAVKHINKNKHRYSLGTFGIFALTKTFILLIGAFSILHFSNIFAQTPVELNSSNIFTDYGCATGATFCELEGRGITSIAADTFVNHTNLQQLYLGNNQLTTIDLSGLSNLQRLYLGNNQLNTIDLSGLSNLQSLELSNNQLNTIDLSGLSVLQYLNLGNNQLSTIPENITTLNNLKDIKLDSNCRDISSMSQNLLSFLDSKAGGNYWQTSFGNSCPISNINITFNVNMKEQIANGSFDPITDTLVVRGSFQKAAGDGQNWNGNYFMMTDPDADGIYSSTATILNDVLNTQYEYKFIMNENRETMAYNRLFQINSTTINLPTVWYNDQVAKITCADVTNISQAECEILSGFYHSTNGDNWTNNKGWFTNTNVSNWFGVKVNNNHVTDIDLGKNNLSGHPYLSGLSNLKNLNLQSNNITSIENGDFNGLTNLENLQLDCNKITSLSEDIINLTSLKDQSGLNIYHNAINYQKFSQQLLNFIDTKHITYNGDWRSTQNFVPEVDPYLCGNEICEADGYCALVDRNVDCTKFDNKSCPTKNSCSLAPSASQNCKGEIDYSKLSTPALCSTYNGNWIDKDGKFYCEKSADKRYSCDALKPEFCPTDYGCYLDVPVSCQGTFDEATITKQQCGNGEFMGTWTIEDEDSCPADCIPQKPEGQLINTVNGDTYTDETGMKPFAGLLFSKSANSTGIVSGDIIHYTLNYHNTRSDTAHFGVLIKDYLPNGLTFLSSSGALLSGYMDHEIVYGGEDDICTQQFIDSTGAYYQLLDDNIMGAMGMSAYQAAIGMLEYTGSEADVGEYFYNNMCVDEKGNTLNLQDCFNDVELPVAEYNYPQLITVGSGCGVVGKKLDKSYHYRYIGYVATGENGTINLSAKFDGNGSGGEIITNQAEYYIAKTETYIEYGKGEKGTHRNDVLKGIPITLNTLITPIYNIELTKKIITKGPYIPGMQIEYQIDYTNRGNLPLSFIGEERPDKNLSLVSFSEKEYETVEAEKIYGITGDVCYDDYLNETGKYMDAVNSRAENQGNKGKSDVAKAQKEVDALMVAAALAEANAAAEGTADTIDAAEKAQKELFEAQKILTEKEKQFTGTTAYEFFKYFYNNGDDGSKITWDQQKNTLGEYTTNLLKEMMPGATFQEAMLSDDSLGIDISKLDNSCGLETGEPTYYVFEIANLLPGNTHSSTVTMQINNNVKLGETVRNTAKALYQNKYGEKYEKISTAETDKGGKYLQFTAKQNDKAVVKILKETKTLIDHKVWDNTSLAITYTNSYGGLDKNTKVAGVVKLNFNDANGNAFFDKPIEINIPIKDTNTYFVKVDHGNGATFEGLTLDPNSSCTNGVSNSPYKGSAISSKKDVITIYSCSASSFIAYTTNTEPTSNLGGGGGGGGGGATLSKDICPENKDCSNSYYDSLCGPCDLEEYKEQQKHGAPDIQFLIQNKELFNQAVEEAKKSTTKNYSTELLQAYVFAKDLGITTMPTIDKADIEGNLIRSHLAKMMTNFAIKTLQIPLNTGAKCDFPDMKNQSEEMQLYAKLSCQLGLMGQGVESFKPNDVVTRAEFGTVLSRMLRGDEFEGGNTYYENHLTALKADGIVTKIENPSAKELRGRTMLMMMRMFEKK